uniref:Ig-like domain-containing protein n=1 Tax=Fundulus heteroclitus TaxID=8078 RepID=A0A3Q2NZ58_FUNHE
MSGFIIKQALLQLCTILLWKSEIFRGSDVTQTPLVWKNKGENATISCSHTKGDLYFQMYWYRQLPGETMKLIVFTTTGGSKHDFGSFSKEKFSATKTVAQSGTFTVKNLEPKDEGLYFCAVSQHSDAGRQRSLTKTPKCNIHIRLMMVCTVGGVQVPCALSPAYIIKLNTSFANIFQQRKYNTYKNHTNHRNKL